MAQLSPYNIHLIDVYLTHARIWALDPDGVYVLWSSHPEKSQDLIDQSLAFLETIKGKERMEALTLPLTKFLERCNRQLEGVVQ